MKNLVLFFCLVLVPSLFADTLDNAIQKQQDDDYEGAIVAYAEAYQKSQNPKILQNLALSYYQSGLPYHAHGAIQKAITLSPRDDQLKAFATSLQSELSLSPKSRSYLQQILSPAEINMLIALLLAGLGILLYLMLRKSRYKASVVWCCLVAISVWCLCFTKNTIADHCLIEDAKLYDSPALDENSTMDLKVGQCFQVLKESRTAIKIKEGTSKGWVSKSVFLGL